MRRLTMASTKDRLENASLGTVVSDLPPSIVLSKIDYLQKKPRAWSHLRDSDLNDYRQHAETGRHYHLPKSKATQTSEQLA